MQACLIVIGAPVMLHTTSRRTPPCPCPEGSAIVSDPSSVIDDLREESEQVDRLVAGLGPEEWGLATPAAGWDVVHQIAHLAWTDRSALLAVTDADGFRKRVEQALAAPHTFVDEGAEEYAKLAPAELLARWREGRAALEKGLRSAAPGTRFLVRAAHVGGLHGDGPAHGDLGPRARHRGRDRCGAAPTDRLRHVAWLGVRTRDFAYGAHGLTPPADPFRVELVAPGGELWEYGPVDAPQRVSGPALDFCLLVTQRAHRADLALTADGPDADRWLDIAQAFAGPSGGGRPPKGRARTARGTPCDGGPADRERLRVLRGPLRRPARDAHRR